MQPNKTASDSTTPANEEPSLPVERRDTRDQLLTAISVLMDMPLDAPGMPKTPPEQATDLVHEGVRIFLVQVRRYLEQQKRAEDFVDPNEPRVWPPSSLEVDCKGVQGLAREVGLQAKALGAAKLQDGTPGQQAALEVAAADMARVALWLEHHFGRPDVS